MASIHVTSALTGTLTCRGTPNNCMPEAMPANSESVTAKFDTISESIATALTRTPKCSRMSDAKPFPVAQPMRADVSCTTMSSTHMMGTVQIMPSP